MANLNKVMLIGRLTREPEVRYTQGGTAVAEFGMAINNTWTDKDGQKKEETDFVDITLWGRQAELAQEYLTKGQQVFIEGRLKFEQWEDKDGNRRSKLKVTGQGMQFLGNRDQSGGAAAPPPSGQLTDPLDPPPGDDIPF